MRKGTRKTTPNHTSEVRPLIVAFVALIILLGATVIAARFPLGSAAVPVSFAIAAAKAFLIMIVFMDLRGSSGVVRLAGFAGILWLAIGITLSLSDYASRGWAGEQPSGLMKATQPRTYDRVEPFGREQ